MKIFNLTRSNRIAVSVLEPLIWVLGKILRLIRAADVRASSKKPSLFIIDGFLIGDAVLLRPLVLSIVEKYRESHRIFLLSGAHSKRIFADIQSSISMITYQFPWATYDYSPKSLARLLRLWWRMFIDCPSIIVETRGDFRSIAWAHLTCPDRLVGFGFTGGRRLLTDVVPDDGSVTHLFAHIVRIARVLNLPIDSHAVHLPRFPNQLRSGKIGISFAGSQRLRQLPLEVVDGLLEGLSSRLANVELHYLVSPGEAAGVLDLIKQKHDSRVRTFSGSFDTYFDLLSTFDLYIGMDSGGGHLASLLHIPSVIIFGTQYAWYSKPIGSHPLLCVESPMLLACRPCDGRTCINATFQKCYLTLDIESIIDFAQAHVGERLVGSQMQTSVRSATESGATDIAPANLVQLESRRS